MDLVEKWGNTGLLSHLTSIDEKIELANLLEELACFLLIIYDNHNTEIGVLIFPAVVRVYINHGLHNIIELYYELSNFWGSIKFNNIKGEIDGIDIDWEAELLAYFCDNYVPNPIRPKKFLKKMKLNND